MKKHNIRDFTRGWFIGSFTPTVIATDAVEVAVQQYKAGDIGARHYHRVATEISHIATGRVKFNNAEFNTGDIIVVEPGEIIEFTAIEDCTIVVVKLPGAIGDKYLV